MPIDVRTARHSLVTALALALGDGFDVQATPNPAPPAVRPRVITGPETIEPDGTACRGVVLALSLYVVTPKLAETGPAEDAVDDAVSAVLAALATIPRVAWTQATRSTFGDGFPCWKISIERNAE